MKLIASTSALVAVSALGLSLAVSSSGIGFYAVAFSASLVLMLATDYSSRARRWEPRSLRVNPAPASAKAHAFQLAA